MNTDIQHKRKPKSDLPNFRAKKAPGHERKNSSVKKAISRKKFKNYFAKESRKLYSQNEILNKHPENQSYFEEMHEHAKEFPQCFSADALVPANLSQKPFNASKAVIIPYSKREHGRQYQKENEREKIPDWYDPGKDSKAVMQGKAGNLFRTQ